MIRALGLFLILGFPAAHAEPIPEECLQEWGEVAPNAEEMIGQLQSALANDRFIHRGYISPLEFRLLDKRKLAEMLVARLDDECEKPRTAPDALPMNSEIVMMVPDKNLPNIAKYGFQNQHLTGSTGGCNCAGDRYRTEQEHMMMQMPYSNKAREVLPKYSAFNIRTSDAGKFDLPTNYGNVALILKPEVNKRATFTYDDSLGTREGSKNFPPRTMSHKRKRADNAKCSGYCEAQIWGPLELGDVAYVMVKKGSEIPDTVKKLGLAVFEYDIPTYDYSIYPPKISMPPVKNSAAQYQRGALLQGASPAHTYSPPSFSRAELEARMEAAKGSAALQSILQSRLIEKYSDEELIEKFSNPPKPITDEGWAGGALSPQKKMIAELAARPVTPQIQEFLLSQRKNPDSEIRAQALIGLSDLPPFKLKPYLLEALKERDPSVKKLAISIAVDSADPEVRDAAKEAAKSDPYYSGSIYRRLTNSKLCGPLPNPEPFAKPEGSGGGYGAGGAVFGGTPYAPSPSPGAAKP